MYDEVLNEEEYNIIGGGLYKVKNCFNNIGSSRLLYDEVLDEVEKGDVKNIMLIFFFIFFFLINN